MCISGFWLFKFFNMTKSHFITIVFSSVLAQVCYGISTEQFLTLTAKEKTALEEVSSYIFIYLHSSAFTSLTNYLQIILQFRPIAVPMVTHEHMKWDTYLIRWIRGEFLTQNISNIKKYVINKIDSHSCQFGSQYCWGNATWGETTVNFKLILTNHNSLKQHFLQNLKWRSENQIDYIRYEDWSDMIADYPVTLDTYDKIGRPSEQDWK